MGYVLVVMSQMGSISHTAPAAPFELGTRELADIQCFGFAERARTSPTRLGLYHACPKICSNLQSISLQGLSGLHVSWYIE